MFENRVACKKKKKSLEKVGSSLLRLFRGCCCRINNERRRSRVCIYIYIYIRRELGRSITHGKQAAA